ncbi:hypothetical protein L0V05_12155 [Tabrizicola sp. J26]|uniref:hypothetical protein n=1 Tax=Alitabrizicola rongguiensis TaxID=2909234 RepID=UPI001F468D3D|nr:hypothetical protein [Tabrizicola rongguiensis]MCF1709568.1 hypothetical protein [Tabrizicola rongguiensis]
MFHNPTNPVGIATMSAVLTLNLASVGDAQQTNGQDRTVRGFVENKCAKQLAAYEATLREGQSFWRLRPATEELPQSVAPERLAIGAWSASVYPLIDAMVLAKSTVRSPQDRISIAKQLDAALGVSNCLSPNESQWAKADKSEPKDVLVEARLTECFMEHASIIRDSLVSDLAGEAFKQALEQQAEAMQTQCKSKE